MNIFRNSFLLFCCMVSTAAFGATGFTLAAEKTRTNSIGMEFILIPSGSFTMGSDENFAKASDDEKPQHRVSISKPFYLGKYEVTQAQWEAVMGNNPSNFKGGNNPVEQVSWDDAQEFIRRLNRQEGHSRYRLPTEAEWEYAARAGSAGVYSFGDDAAQLETYAWYGERNSGATHPVGRKQPDARGLHDMYGNVWEWVQDWFAEEYYSYSPSVDPAGPASGSQRVIRGGGWNNSASNCRSAYRYYYPPDGSAILLGFRLVLSL
ncbi:MAG: formylglycine-generating enzyme family protein [Deltaproteobacteria bacterium]|jgi:formylglycine-generating enzyme required for sulfatase activity|nr:formylglycine-generating enzyme family protein [Deltaproteobacteria bacterium]